MNQADTLSPSPIPGKPGPVLGIETSCDETAVAILGPEGDILAEALHSQSEHTAYGGVVPEIAARAHLELLPPLLARTMEKAGLAYTDLAAIAATSGPGLIGGLIVGSNLAKGLAIGARRPFLGINHLEAHALTPRLPGLVPGGLAFPYLLLLISGGHCQCVAVEALGRYRTLGTTIDDAVGEAFDKAAKILGLGWPGGPALERLALTGNAAAFPLPRPLLGRPGCDFSFSGLKTALARLADANPTRAPDLAASFQAACADVLADRARHALAIMPAATALVAAGGVAANTAIRTALEAVAKAAGLPLIAPPPRLCGDNAVMIAWTGIERLRAGLTSPLDLPPRPRWPLDELEAPRPPGEERGAGV